MKQKLLGQQRQRLSHTQKQIPLPSLEVRQKQWEDAYRKYSVRANLRTAKRDIAARDYWHEENKRIMAGVDMVHKALGMYKKAELSFGLTGLVPERILNLGTGVGLFDAKPGNLAVTAAENGYSYAGCDFSKIATTRCKKRVETALRRQKASTASTLNISFHTQGILSFLKKQPSHSVSVIILFQVLQHMNEVEVIQLSDEMKRVLYRSGLICIEFPPRDENNPKYFNHKRTRLHHLSFIEGYFNPYELLAEKTLDLFQSEKSFFGIFGMKHFHKQR